MAKQTFFIFHVKTGKEEEKGISGQITITAADIIVLKSKKEDGGSKKQHKAPNESGLDVRGNEEN